MKICDFGASAARKFYGHSTVAHYFRFQQAADRRFKPVDAIYLLSLV